MLSSALSRYCRQQRHGDGSSALCHLAVQTRERHASHHRAGDRRLHAARSGLGSFARVYDLYEDPASVTNTFVVHAHNDYAELALETGVPGNLLMLLFLAWWAAAWRIWQSAEAGPFARAAAIASAAILAHSLVDFPLRTAAIAPVRPVPRASRRSPGAADRASGRPSPDPAPGVPLGPHQRRAALPPRFRAAKPGPGINRSCDTWIAAVPNGRAGRFARLYPSRQLVERDPR